MTTFFQFPCSNQALFSATVNVPGLLPIGALTRHQREQMDPNLDYAFGDVPCMNKNFAPPCPNGGADVQYLLRWVVEVGLLLICVAIFSIIL